MCHQRWAYASVSRSAELPTRRRGLEYGHRPTHCRSSRCHRRYHVDLLFPRWAAARVCAAHPRRSVARIFQSRSDCRASRHRVRRDEGLRMHSRDAARSRTSVSLDKWSARPRELHRQAQANVLHPPRLAARTRCGAARRGRQLQAAWRGRRLRSRQCSRVFSCHGGLRRRFLLEPERTRTSITDARGPAIEYSAGRHCTCTCGLVAMTSASHAEGRQFDPGQVYLLAMRRRWSTRASGQRSRVRSEAPDKRLRTCALSPRGSRIAASIIRLAGNMGPRGGWLTAALARLAGDESSPEACFQSVPSSRTRGVSTRASA